MVEYKSGMNNAENKARLLGAVLGVFYTGCQIAPSAPESVPPPATSTATREFTGGEMYDTIWGKLDAQQVFYQYLHGIKGRETDRGYNPFYQDKTEYLRFNDNELPCTIGFRFENGDHFILANCGAFIGANAFELLETNQSVDPQICAPVSDEKKLSIGD